MMLLKVLACTILALTLILPASPAGAWVHGHHVDECATGHIAVDRPEAVWPEGLSSTQGQVTPMITAGDEHTVGLKSDGTVIAVGSNRYGQCNVANWNLNM